MKKYKKIFLLVSVVIIVCVSNTGNAKNYRLSDYMKNPFLTTEYNYNFFSKNTKCSIEKLENGNYLMKMICLKNPIFGKKDFNKNIDNIRPSIKDFDQEYTLEKDSFYYSGNAQPIFKNPQTQKKYNYLKQLKKTLDTQNIYMSLNINPETEIELTKGEIQLADILHYSFYPARRHIHELGPCSKINYGIAIASIDKKLIPAQENFNINRRIAYRRGYCKAQNSIPRPFYGGVCGASTQVFRVSLLHPFLQNFDRKNHRIWYSRYYGKKITGDDSSIIDFRQTLTIKNISDAPIYFKYLEIEKEKNIVLVGISPKKFNKTVKITKEKTGKLSTKLSKEVYGKNCCKSYQERNSKYKLIDDGIAN